MAISAISCVIIRDDANPPTYTLARLRFFGRDILVGAQRLASGATLNSIEPLLRGYRFRLGGIVLGLQRGARLPRYEKTAAAFDGTIDDVMSELKLLFGSWAVDRDGFVTSEGVRRACVTRTSAASYRVDFRLAPSHLA